MLVTVDQHKHRGVSSALGQPDAGQWASGELSELWTNSAPPAWLPLCRPRSVWRAASPPLGLCWAVSDSYTCLLVLSSLKENNNLYIYYMSMPTTGIKTSMWTFNCYWNTGFFLRLMSQYFKMHHNGTNTPNDIYIVAFYMSIWKRVPPLFFPITLSKFYHSYNVLIWHSHIFCFWYHMQVLTYSRYQEVYELYSGFIGWMCGHEFWDTVSLHCVLHLHHAPHNTGLPHIETSLQKSSTTKWWWISYTCTSKQACKIYLNIMMFTPDASKQLSLHQITWLLFRHTADLHCLKPQSGVSIQL